MWGTQILVWACRLNLPHSSQKRLEWATRQKIMAAQSKRISSGFFAEFTLSEAEGLRMTLIFLREDFNVGTQI